MRIKDPLSRIIDNSIFKICLITTLLFTTTSFLDAQCNAFESGFETGDVSEWSSIFPFNDPTSKNQAKADKGFSASMSLMSDPAFTNITPLTGSYFGEIWSNSGSFLAGISVALTIPDTATSAMFMWNDWWAYSLSGAAGTDISVNIRVRRGADLLINMTTVNGAGAALNPGTGWVAKSLDLTPYIGDNISIEFRVASNAATGYAFQYALDDVKLALQPCPIAADPEIVPTMGEWSIISLGLLLAIIGVIAFKQREVLVKLN